MTKNNHSPNPPVTTHEAASSLWQTILRNVETALNESAEAEADRRAHPDDSDPPALSRDPREPMGKTGETAPRIESTDEERAEVKAVEAGIEAAERELTEEGRKQRPL